MRKILIGLFIVFAVLSLSARFFIANAVSKAVQTSSGVPLEVGRISFGIFPLRAGIHDVKFRNPKGFKEKWLAVVPELYVEIGGFDFIKKTVTLREVRVNLKSVTVERNNAGQVNAIELKKQLDQKRRQTPAPAPEPVPSPGKSKEKKTPSPGMPVQVKIQKAVVNVGSVFYVDGLGPNPVTKEYKIGVTDKVLTNVTDPISLTEQILTLVLERVGLNVLGANWDKMGAEFGQQAAEIAEKAKATLEGLFKEK